MTGDPRLRDRVMWAVTMRVPLVYRARCWWAHRKDRPGFRPSEYR